MSKYEMFSDIQLLNTLMARLSNAYSIKDVSLFRRDRWSSTNEYPIFYSLITLYDIENVIECGTNAGASALSFAAGLKNNNRTGKVYTWDIESVKGVDQGTNLENLIIRHIQPYSEAILPELSGPVLYFIDGDHSEESCFADLNHTTKFIKTEDIILIHDIVKHQPVKDAVNKFLEINQRKCRIIPTSCGIGIIKW